MRLRDSDINEFLATGRIVISPVPDATQVSGVSVDLTLGNSFRAFKGYAGPYIDLSGSRESINAMLQQIMSEEIILPEGDAFFLHPGELALAVTQESITLPPDVVGWLDGRSSLARLGLMVHATAHRIDPGWSGKIVLEFLNGGKLPLALRPGMCIGAISFELLAGPADRPYSSRNNAKYRDQGSAVASKIAEEQGS